MKAMRILRVSGALAVAGALLATTAPAASADQIREDQWALQAFVADDVWKEATGKGVTVAILDTSVQEDHPDLEGSILPGIRLKNGEPAGGRYASDHGTAMASIIAGHGHGDGGEKGIKGLAPDSEILPVDVYSNAEKEQGVGGSLAEGLRYAVDNGADIVNVSTSRLVITEPDKNAIAYALNNGVAVVASSGNSGNEDLMGLAKHPGVVTVGAIDQGLKIWENSTFGTGMTLTAPGTNMRSAGVGGKYRLTEGTSNSAAYVSAALALIREKFPDLTPGQAVNRLVKTALLPDHVKDRKTPDKKFGYGIVRPYTALTKKIDAGPEDGPLEIPPMPEKKKPFDSTSGSDSDKADSSKEASSNGDSNFVIFAVGGGIAGFVLILVGVLVAVNRSKRRNNTPPAYGTPGPGQPQFPPPYGQQPPPPQQPRW